MTRPTNTPTETNIRTRKDGSIDTQYYMQRGRMARSEAAVALVFGTAKDRRARAPKRGFFGL